MRIRSTKPEFWRSRRVAAVSWDARLVVKGLESYVDDNGVGKDDIAMIVGDIFARDMFASPRETVARVSEAISELHNAGLVWRYHHEDTDLIYISFWESIQRIDKPGKGRFRRPDGTMEYGESKIRESVANVRESVAPGTGEQGNRGTDLSCASADAEREDEEPAAAIDAEFAEWYDAWPRKRSKAHAAKAYRAARKKVSAETLLEAARQQVPTLTRKGVEFCPYPASWLNGERWDDELDNVHHLPQPDPEGRIELPPLPSRDPWGGS